MTTRREQQLELKNIILYDGSIKRLDGAMKATLQKTLEKATLIKRLKPETVLFSAHISNIEGIPASASPNLVRIVTYSSGSSGVEDKLPENHPARSLLRGSGGGSDDICYPPITELSRILKTSPSRIKVYQIEGIPAFYGKGVVYLPPDIFHSYGKDHLDYVDWFLSRYLSPPKLIPFSRWAKTKKKGKIKKKKEQQIILEALNRSSKVKKVLAASRISRCQRRIRDSGRRIEDWGRAIRRDRKYIVEDKKTLGEKERVYTSSELRLALAAIPHIKRIKIEPHTRSDDSLSISEMRRRLGYLIEGKGEKRIDSYKFCIETDDIYIKYGESSVLIGAFLITFNCYPDHLATGERAFRAILIKNLTNERERDGEVFAHPHVEGGRPCWGREGERIERLLDMGDPIALLTYIISYLQSYNRADPLLQIGYWMENGEDEDAEDYR